MSTAVSESGERKIIHNSFIFNYYFCSFSAVFLFVLHFFEFFFHCITRPLKCLFPRELEPTNEIIFANKANESPYSKNVSPLNQSVWKESVGRMTTLSCATKTVNLVEFVSFQLTPIDIFKQKVSRNNYAIKVGNWKYYSYKITQPRMQAT